MKSRILGALFVSTALTATPAAWGQSSPPPEEAQAANATVPVPSSDNDIVVTARREAENVQRVPVSVQVVTQEAIQRQAITEAEQLSRLAPGLTLAGNTNQPEVTLRGVTWQPGSGTPATPIYLNEVPFDPASTIASLFDVGQVEVLRGPQGTTRGAPSISGAVTITTHRPDLASIGGYIQGLYGEGHHYDVQGAINLPIIRDVLAVRVAGNVERSRGNRVYSVNSNIDPLYRDQTFRGTILFQPTDTLSIEGMYQRRRTLQRVFTQVAGTGSPGFPGFPGVLPAIPANYNGPALSVDDRLSVQDNPGITNTHIDLVTVNASWRVFGQVLSVNYGHQSNTSPRQFNELDFTNIVPGFSSYLTVDQPNNYLRTIEVRLSSQPDEGRPFDYDIGWFSKKSDGLLNVSSPYYLTGAFLGQVFDSFYGNVRFHLDDRTELSGGLAILRDRVPVDLNVQTFAAAQNIGSLAVLRSSFPPFLQPLVTSCEIFAQFAGNPLITTSPTYAGTCDFNIPAGFSNSRQTSNERYSKAIYNFSLSRQFTPDLLVYATTGTSFRSGLPAINNTGLPGNLFNPEPETATSYEIGFKSTLLNRRLRINADVFQLNYGNQLTTFEGVPYFNSITGGISQTSLAFYRNIDARVRGFELEVAGRPTNNLSLAANVSYSRITSRGGLVPCNDPTRPITAANPINLCQSARGQVLNQRPPFQARVNGDYTVPITDAFGGYFRFNVNYQGRNPNFGNFPTGTGGFRRAPAFTVVDLFAGVSAHNGAWDIGLYARNVLNERVELNRIATVNSVYTQFAASSGYDQVRTNLPREAGVILRYSFGSR